MKAQWFVLLVAGSFACKKKSAEQAPPTPPPPAVADAAPTADAPDATVAPAPDAAAAAAPTPPAGAIAVTEAGVGPIGEETKLDVKALGAALPGFDAKKASISHGGDLADEHVAVSKGGKLALKIYGDGSPTSIEVVSDAIWNPWGLKIGTTHAEVAKVVGPLECTDGGEHTDWKSVVAECNTDKTQNWAFDFELDGFDAKELLDKPDQLATAKLVALRWTAPSSGPPIPQ